MTQPISVLVVEDEALVRMGIAQHLSDEGFKVYEAAGADQAIDILAAHSDIKVLFTDIDMPGRLDGLKLAAAVRDRWPPVKIVITSGQRSVEAREMPSGARFFTKPYNPDELASVFRLIAA